MRKIHSLFNPNILLCIIQKKCEFEFGRVNLSNDEEYLQVATISQNKDCKFIAHKHIKCSKQITITQEAWVIISGKVLFKLYDINNCLIEEIILTDGDCAITFNGGHSYEILDDFTKIYEFKNGPYLSQELDKEFIK